MSASDEARKYRAELRHLNDELSSHTEPKCLVAATRLYREASLDCIASLRAENEALRIAAEQLLECFDNNPPYVPEGMELLRAALAAGDKP